MDRIIILRIKYAACEIWSVIIRWLSRGLVTALTDGVSDWRDAKDVGKYVCMYLRRQMMCG